MAKDNKPSKLGDILRKITRRSIEDNIKAQNEKDREKSYDIRKIFEQMELDLISSMYRAFYFHKAEQEKEGFNWEQWQLTKLREIEKYRRRNKTIVDSYSAPIQKAIDRELGGSFKKGKDIIAKLVNKIKNAVISNKEAVIELPSDTSENQRTKEYIAKILNRSITPGNEEAFFGINDKKLEALQNTVKQDLKKAQYSVLRKMDDVYRQTTFKSHIYLQSGAKTINQAVDMATHDFLNKGINSVVYKNGARVNIASYAEMALRTASQRATFLGEAKKRDEWGLHLVVVSAHANTCEHCMPWQGRILIDDVFSHPSKEYIQENSKYPLLSEAIKSGLLHPNCRHTLITYFPGITQLSTVLDGKEAVRVYNAEQQQREFERQIRRWKRIAVGSVDAENASKSVDKVKELENKLKQHLKDNPELRRDYNREEPKQGISNSQVKATAKLLKEQAESAKIEEARNKILNSEYDTTVRTQKQKEHIVGTKQWKDYYQRKIESNSDSRPTMFNKGIDVQQLINEYKGTGIIEFARKNDVFPREYISTDKIVGKYWDDEQMKYMDANRFAIIYSSKGTHAYPIRPLKKGE